MSLLSATAKSFDSKTLAANKLNEGQKPNKKRVFFHTLGCRLNQSETAVLARSFEQQGYVIVPDFALAEVYVLNTCTVTEHSDAKNRQIIRKVHRKNPKAIIAIVGCYSQIDPESVAKIEGVNLVIGNEEKMRLTHYLAQVDFQTSALIIRPKINKTTFTAPVIHNSPTFSANTKLKQTKMVESNVAPSNSKPKYSGNVTFQQSTRALLKIQDGCDFMCSFCIIPFARGRSRYREFSNLQEEAKMLVQEGIREIVITGINVGTYKTGKRTLVDVVDFLNTLSGLSRIRISSIEPTTVPELLFQYMSDPQHKLVPFFHLPLQSGSDIILQKMKRRYSSEEYKEEIWRAFESVPDLCIGTDVMVGFPEENELDFKSTVKLLEKLPIAYFHVFPFSPRAGTPAFRRKEQILPQVKNKRGEFLRSLSATKHRAFFNRFLGQCRNVLWESKKPDGTFSGYTDNYIRVVMDELYSSDLQNQFLTVRLTGIKGQTMLGKIS